MRRFFIILAVLSVLTQPARAESVKILASIQPLGLIAHEIGEGVAEVQILVPAGASPHDFALRPSDRQRIADTDLLLWVGASTEPYLARVANSVAQELAWILDTESESDHQHGHDHSSLERPSHEESHGHHDDHQPKDHSGPQHDHTDEAHPWLDPQAALDYASRIAALLSQMRPEASIQISDNLERFRGQLMQLDQDLSQQLKPVSTKGFLVFHRAYDSLVEHYGLNQLDALMLDPSRKPGAKQMQKLRELVQSGSVSCVFVEPQFNASLLETLVRDTGVNQGVLDPLASSFELNTGSYSEYLQSLVDEIVRCLSAD